MTNNNANINVLLDIMARLRNPDGGCPWDLKQTYQTIAPYTIEEAYEVADAVERNDIPAIKDELGDLLLQVVFQAQIAREAGHFVFQDVVDGIANKMIHRHPHVFGDAKAADATDVEQRIWEQQKSKEKKKDSILDDVPQALPALKRAQKLQKRVAQVGFEWPEAIDVLDKMEEEIAEMREAIKRGKVDEIKDELGDLFFVLTNFGRMLGVDCEDAARQANNKFERRFRAVESALKARNKKPEDSNLQEMEELWQDVKRTEKKTATA